MTDSIELKLTSFAFKPQPKPLKIRWVRLIEVYIDGEFSEFKIAELDRQLKAELDRQLKMGRLLRAAASREVAYRKRVDLFLEQMEGRKCY